MNPDGLRSSATQSYTFYVSTDHGNSLKRHFSSGGSTEAARNLLLEKLAAAGFKKVTLYQSINGCVRYIGPFEQETKWVRK